MSNDTLPIDINPQYKRIRWHLRQTTVEIGLNDRGQRAHAAKKNNEKKTKKLHSAKLNAPQPNLLQMIRRRAMCQRWSRFAGRGGSRTAVGVRTVARDDAVIIKRKKARRYVYSEPSTTVIRKKKRYVHYSEPGQCGNPPCPRSARGQRRPAPRLFIGVMDDLSYAQVEGDEGRILAAMKITIDEDARAIARRIVDLYHALDRLLR